MVRPLPRASALFVTADQMSGDGEAFEVVAGERTFRGEKRVGVAPRLASERIARILQRCRHTPHFARGS